MDHGTLSLVGQCLWYHLPKPHHYEQRWKYGRNSSRRQHRRSLSLAFQRPFIGFVKCEQGPNGHDPVVRHEWQGYLSKSHFVAAGFTGDPGKFWKATSKRFISHTS